MSIKVLYQEHTKGNMLIGNIGRLSEQKGMSYFIEAAEITAKTHPEARFIIVGDGEKKEQLHAQVKARGIQDKVLFLGYAKAAEQAKKAEAESVLKKLLAEGMSADEILAKLK